MRNRIRVLAVVCFGLSLFAVAGGVDGGVELPFPTVPPAIGAATTQRVAFKYFAKGTQNYRCGQQPDGGYGWSFVAPEANLYAGADERAPAAGTHFAGPSWKSGKDGSTFVGDGANAQRANAPDPAAAIPWLLVPKKSSEGAGSMATVSFVQRVNTAGGVAPAATTCTATSTTTVQKVPYTATYYFYTPR